MKPIKNAPYLDLRNVLMLDRNGSFMILKLKDLFYAYQLCYGKYPQKTIMTIEQIDAYIKILEPKYRITPLVFIKSLLKI